MRLFVSIAPWLALSLVACSEGGSDRATTSTAGTTGPGAGGAASVPATSGSAGTGIIVGSGGGLIGTGGSGSVPDAGRDGCIPVSCESPAGQFCGQIGDGCGGTLECNAPCPQGWTCGGGGVEHVCGASGAACATPVVCAAAGGPRYCGKIGSGCGGVLDCGAACPDGSACGSGGSPNICGGAAPCTNLCSKQVRCAGTATTSLSGTVLAPTQARYGKADPVYNAIVYVPNGTVEPFKPGVSCDRCGVPASGSPLVATLTGFDGKFTLTNVPAGDDIPLVIQLGKWRRQVVVPRVASCVDTSLPTELTRLPRNKSEGDIPQIAIATSSFDFEECVFRKMGIDDAEFTAPAMGGRVHLYTGQGATLPGSPDQAELWATLDKLKTYDVVLLPCAVPGDDAPARQRVLEYTNLGGRVFATDLSHPWFSEGPAAFRTTARWVPYAATGVPSLASSIDQSFPKGAALAQWLQFVGATTTVGSISLSETYVVTDAVNAPTTRWVYSSSPATLQTFSFNTPVGAAPAAQCGRAVFSTFHVALPGQMGTPGQNFPSECDANPLTPQEKVLEFLLFDVASCVQSDLSPPPPPPAAPPSVPPPPPPPPPPPR